MVDHQLTPKLASLLAILILSFTLFSAVNYQPKVLGTTDDCPLLPSGDLDCDQKISIADFAIWKLNFLNSRTEKPLARIVTSAKFFDSTKKYLTSGDQIYVAAIRTSPDSPLTQANFSSSLKVLTDIDTSTTGIVKSIAFSSLTDLKTYISQIPPTVTRISFNMEGGMTPTSESNPNNLVATITEFKNIVHQYNRHFSWGPTYAFLSGASDNLLQQIISQIDSLGIQYQKLLETGGVNQFTTAAEKDIKYFRSINPSLKISVQFVIGRNPTDSILAAYQNIKTLADYIILFTANDPDTLIKLLSQLRS